MANKNQTNEQTQEEPKKRRVFSRRNFLIDGGIVLGGAVAAVCFCRTPLRRQVAQLLADFEIPHSVNNLEVDFLFEIQADNSLLIKAPKAEMG